MTAVVIAGGKSRRMKSDKAFVTVGGTPLIERVLRVITPLFSEVFINSNTPEAYAGWNIPVFPDISPHKGALGGIYTALTHSRTEYTFCVACDMPDLNPHLIQFMQEQMKDYDVLIPSAPDGYHPLHAIYSNRCRKIIETLLEENQLKIAMLFDRVPTRYLTSQQIRQFDPNFESFANLNTLEELERARQRFR